jgi:hypothetical protein
MSKLRAYVEKGDKEYDRPRHPLMSCIEMPKTA